MLRVLGPISIDGPDGQSRSLSRVQRHLLAALVAAGPRGISLDSLAHELWADELPPTWSASLRNHLARLRTAIAPATLPTRGGVCRLDLEPHQVDAWLLLAPRTSAEWTNDLVWLLEPLVPYENVDPSDRIAQSTNRILAARRQIFEAFATEDNGPVSAAIRDVMRSTAYADPFDEHLATLSATADANAGELARALTTVEHNTSIIRHELGDAACRSLDEFTESLGSQRQQSAVAPLSPPDAKRCFPNRLVALTAQTLIGGEQQLPDALTWLRTSTLPRHLSVEGEWAAGKSRFLAHVAHALFDDGATIRFAQGSPALVAYEGLLTVLPELRPALETLAEQLTAALPDQTASTSQSIEQTVLWSQAATLVEDLAVNRPLVLVVDDAHHLDAPSTQLLAFLLRVQPSGSLTLITGSMRGLVPMPLAGSGASDRTIVVLQPLDRAAVTCATQRAFPQASPASIRPLAAAAMQLSGGLPSLLHAVLDTTDPITLVPPSGLQSHDGVKLSLLDGVSEFDWLVGAAVVVLARGVADQARLADIAKVSGQSVEHTLDALDRLVERQLLIDGPRPDTFRVRHSPAARAFLAACSRSQLRQVHAALSKLAPAPRRRAHRPVAPMPSLELTQGVPALALPAGQRAGNGLAHGERPRNELIDPR